MSLICQALLVRAFLLSVLVVSVSGAYSQSSISRESYRFLHGYSRINQFLKEVGRRNRTLTSHRPKLRWLVPIPLALRGRAKIDLDLYFKYEKSFNHFDNLVLKANEVVVWTNQGNVDAMETEESQRLQLSIGPDILKESPHGLVLKLEHQSSRREIESNNCRPEPPLRNIVTVEEKSSIRTNGIVNLKKTNLAEFFSLVAQEKSLEIFGDLEGDSKSILIMNAFLYKEFGEKLSVRVRDSLLSSKNSNSSVNKNSLDLAIRFLPSNLEKKQPMLALVNKTATSLELQVSEHAFKNSDSFLKFWLENYTNPIFFTRSISEIDDFSLFQKYLSEEYLNEGDVRGQSISLKDLGLKNGNFLIEGKKTSVLRASFPRAIQKLPPRSIELNLMGNNLSHVGVSNENSFFTVSLNKHLIYSKSIRNRSNFNELIDIKRNYLNSWNELEISFHNLGGCNSVMTGSVSPDSSLKFYGEELTKNHGIGFLGNHIQRSDFTFSYNVFDERIINLSARFLSDLWTYQWRSSRYFPEVISKKNFVPSKSSEITFHYADEKLVNRNIASASKNLFFKDAFPILGQNDLSYFELRNAGLKNVVLDIFLNNILKNGFKSLLKPKFEDRTNLDASMFVFSGDESVIGFQKDKTLSQHFKANHKYNFLFKWLFGIAFGFLFIYLFRKLFFVKERGSDV